MTRFIWRISIAATVLAAAGFVDVTPVRAEGSIIVENGIEYSNPDDQHLQLDMARPDGAGPYPAVVCIHGGGFRAGIRQAYDGLIKKLAQNGYVAVTVSYRLSPKYQFPAAVYDVKAAVRWRGPVRTVRSGLAGPTWKRDDSAGWH